jgi:hypothetical protein
MRKIFVIVQKSTPPNTFLPLLASHSIYEKLKIVGIY